MLEVIKMGHPTLREISQELTLEELAQENTQTFIDDLVATMKSENGAGIAAPQVGVLKRIFAMECDNNPRYPNKEQFPLSVVINPIVTPIGEEKIDSWEGCLSIPNIRGMLPRYKEVNLKGLDRHGVSYSIDLDGFGAVVAQHEMDHLDGILFIDRMEDMKQLSFLKEFIQFKMKREEE